MSDEKRYRSVRCKTSYGYVVSWTIRKNKNDKWVVSGVGKARMGNRPCPCEFLPFEISDVVMTSCQREFDNLELASEYVRSI
jgi:hypothetical protein